MQDYRKLANKYYKALIDIATHGDHGRPLSAEALTRIAQAAIKGRYVDPVEAAERNLRSQGTAT